MERTFIHLKRAWYGGASLGFGGYVDEVLLRIAGDDTPNGEIMIRWYALQDLRRPAPRLEVFDDAWAALGVCGDVLAWMASQDNQNATAEDVCQALTVMGFTDATPIDDDRSAALAARIEQVIKEVASAG